MKVNGNPYPQKAQKRKSGCDFDIAEYGLVRRYYAQLAPFVSTCQLLCRSYAVYLEPSLDNGDFHLVSFTVFSFIDLSVNYNYVRSTTLKFYPTPRVVASNC
jgi:hypothetical protein